MTDERIPDLIASVRRLPRGSGIVFRHYATPLPERSRLFRRLHRIAVARGLLIVRAGADRMPGEAGTHARRGGGFITWPVHDRKEAMRAVRRGADALFVSPIHATRSHTGAPGIGGRAGRRIGQGFGVPLIALGGMNARRFHRLRASGFHGWAAIDALCGSR
jgi:thiamine-phosphate pyrophosphorylase